MGGHSCELGVFGLLSWMLLKNLSLVTSALPTAAMTHSHRSVAVGQHLTSAFVLN